VRGTEGRLTWGFRVAPRAGLEPATYCLGGLRWARPDLAHRRSLSTWRARGRPSFTADHRPIGHATGTLPARAAAIAVARFVLRLPAWPTPRRNTSLGSRLVSPHSGQGMVRTKAGSVRRCVCPNLHAVPRDHLHAVPRDHRRWIATLAEAVPEGPQGPASPRGRG
jgi:hypothetical protein